MDRDGEVAIGRHVKKKENDVAESTAPRDTLSRIVKRFNTAKVRLACTSKAYNTRRPWFLWLQMQINSSSSFEFVHDPLVESPSYKPGVEFDDYQWDTNGKGIFVTQIEKSSKSNAQQAETQVTPEKPTLFCTWDDPAAPPHNHEYKAPKEYKERNPPHRCSEYSGTWNPAWISVSNDLASRLQVTVKKGDETSSIRVDVSEGTPAWPSYGDRIISGSHADYGKHAWTLVVRVGDNDPLRGFDVTLKKPMGRLESEAQNSEGTGHGWVLHIKVWGILFVEKNHHLKEVCAWSQGDASSSTPHCSGSGQTFHI